MLSLSTNKNECTTLQDVDVLLFLALRRVVDDKTAEVRNVLKIDKNNLSLSSFQLNFLSLGTTNNEVAAAIS